MVSGLSVRTERIIHSQNAKGFRMGVVYPEYLHTPGQSRKRTMSKRKLGPKRLPIRRVEVQRVDVLVALRGILRMADTSVGKSPKPFRMVFHPRMIRGRPGRQDQSQHRSPGSRLPRRDPESHRVFRDRDVSPGGPLEGADGPQDCLGPLFRLWWHRLVPCDRFGQWDESAAGRGRRTPSAVRNPSLERTSANVPCRVGSTDAERGNISYHVLNRALSRSATTV